MRKQVSKCLFCNIKYEPIVEDEEFGVGEFNCKICNHEFKYSKKTSQFNQIFLKLFCLEHGVKKTVFLLVKNVAMNVNR